LYIDSIVFNYDLNPHDQSENSKSNSKHSREELNSMTLDQLQSLISKDTLNSLNESDRHNPVRLIRIIEKGDTKQTKGEALQHIYFVIDRELEQLKNRMATRIEFMIENGLVEENLKLLRKGFNYDMQSMRSIGYREFKNYLTESKDNTDSETGMNDVKEDILTHTLQYAKRQRTWFRRNKNAIWTSDYDEILSNTQKFLTTV
jgi:tRNA dimethylallyltransferase